MMKIVSRSTWAVSVAAGLLLIGQVACGPGSNSDDGKQEPAGTDAVGGSANLVGGAGSVGGSAAPVGGAASVGGGGGTKPLGTGGSITTGGMTGAGGMGGPVKPIWPDGRGPSVAFTTYEAVTLSQTGQQVAFKTKAASNSIVVRYSVPDGGHDYWTTLGVFVDGTSRGKLQLTSRYSWTYGDDSVFNKPPQEDKGSGNEHHFFDEAHALIGEIPVGSSVVLRKEADDTASAITVDLVEIEQVGGPLAQPANSISIKECGAVPDDTQDDSNAIQKCIDQAQGLNKVVFIPPGRFQSFGKTLSAQKVTIRGAGMWYSSIVGFHAQINCWGDGACKYYDFALFGDTVLRDDASPETGFRGNLSNSVIENIWIEHLKVGIWPDRGSGPLAVTSVRIRNLMADGVNFYNGTHDSYVENSHFRNTGDDAIAAWSDTHLSSGPSKNNVFRKNYIQIPWKANCFGIYGGHDNRIEDNVCADTVQYPGMFFAEQFSSHAFTGTTEANRNTLLRAGGNAYNHTHGALKFHADQAPVGNIKINTLDIIDPTNAGVHASPPALDGGATSPRFRICQQ